MHETLKHSQVASRITERRKDARVQFKSLAYVELDQDNGGLILNISEGGIAVQTAAPIAGNIFPKMRFCIPQSSKWIEASGKLVWEGESRKEAGIQFIEFNDEGRELIQNWIYSGASASSVHISAEPDGSKDSLREEELSSSTLKSDTATISAEFDSIFPSEKTLASVPMPARDVADVDRARHNHAAQQSLNSQEPILRVDGTGPAELPRNRSASLPVAVDQITGRAFYEELIATHAAATNSHSLHPSSIRPPMRVREGTPTAPDLAPGSIVFPGLGYQPAEFEEPSGHGWLLVTAILVGVLALGAVLAMGPANVKALFVRHNSSAVVDPPPPTSVPETTPRSPNGPAASSETDHLSQEPASPPDTHVEISQTAPKAITKEMGSESFRLDGQGSQKDPSDSAEAEAVTRRFQLEHSQINRAASSVSVPGASDGSEYSRRQEAVPPINASAAAPIVEVPAAVPSTPQTPAVSSGTVAIRSHFHSIWGSNSPPNPSDGLLQIGQLASIRQPVYSAEAERARVEGTVGLRVIVDKAGAVEIVQLVGGPPILASGAINAVRQWRYGPTFLNGRPVESVEDVSIVFRLANSASSP